MYPAPSALRIPPPHLPALFHPPFSPLLPTASKTTNIETTMPPDLNSVPPSPKPQVRVPPRVSTSASSRRTSSTMPPPSATHSTFVSPTLPPSMAAGDEGHTSAGSGMYYVFYVAAERRRKLIQTRTHAPSSSSDCCRFTSPSGARARRHRKSTNSCLLIAVNLSPVSKIPH